MTRRLPATIAALLLAATLAGCGDGAAGPTAAPPSEPAALKARGVLTIELPNFAWNPGEGCWGRETFEHLRADTTVTIYDNTSTTVGLGKLSNGTVAMQADGKRAESCTFVFEVPDVPAGRKFYSVEVAGEDRLQVAEGDLGRIRLRVS